MYKKIVILLAIVHLTGCSGANKFVELKPNPKESQIREDLAFPTITSKKKHILAISPYQSVIHGKDKTAYLVYFKNQADYPINFGTDNIEIVYIPVGSSKEKKIIVQSYDDALNDINESEIEQKSSARSAAAWMAYGAAMASQDTYTTRHSGSFTGNTYGSSYNSQGYYGSYHGTYGGTYSGTSETKVFNSERFKLLNENNQKIHASAISSIDNYHRSKKEMLDSIGLRDTSVVKGGDYMGLFYSSTESIGLSSQGEFIITIKIDGEEHVFEVSRHPLDITSL